MTDSRADRRPRHSAGILLAGLLACSCLVPSVAGAQPLQLFRPTPRSDAPASPAPNAAPAQQPVQTPAPPGRDAPGSVAPDAAAPIYAAPPEGTAGTALPMRPLDKSAIVVNTLDVIDPDAIGVLGEAEGGFPIGLWQGTDWALVSGLIPRLPARSPSPTLRRLASRLLLSRASVPAGKPPNESFVALRVDRLLAMGDLADALALLNLVPEQSRDERFARTEIEAMFYDNRISEACGKATSVAGQYEDDYWKQALAFCLALGGDSPRAALIADLLRERAAGIDPAFFTAIETLGGLKPPEGVSLKSPSGLLLAMMRAARIRLADDMDGADRPIVLRGVALSPNASLEARLAAAEKAYAAGALSTDEIIRLYLSISFTSEELMNPISQAEANWGPRGRALLIRAASVQDVALAKAETLRRAWALGREKGGYAEIARASVPALEAIPPSADLIWFAQDAARVLFSGGRLEAALRWYAVIAADKDRVDEARSAEAALWPLALLAGDGDTVPWAPERLDGWYDAQRKAQPEHAQRRALALYALLEATGRAVPPPVWRRLLQGPVVSAEPGLNVAWSEGLSGAAENGRIGETVLLTAVGAAATGDEPFASVAAGRQAISALRHLGLAGEARQLSIELAVAAGL